MCFGYQSETNVKSVISKPHCTEVDGMTVLGYFLTQQINTYEYKFTSLNLLLNRIMEFNGTLPHCHETQFS